MENGLKLNSKLSAEKIHLRGKLLFFYYSLSIFDKSYVDLLSLKLTLTLENMIIRTLLLSTKKIIVRSLSFCSVIWKKMKSEQRDQINMAVLFWYLDKTLFTRYPKHTAMYNWSPCTILCNYNRIVF